MKDEKPLQAKDRLLNLFIDGEMSPEKAAEYRTEVLAEDLNAQAEHLELLAVRREVRNYSAEQAVNLLTDIKSEQLWQRIEKELEREVEKPLTWWQTFSIRPVSVFGQFSLSGAGFATATAIIAFVVGVQFGSNSELSSKGALIEGTSVAGESFAKLASYSNSSSVVDNFEFKLKSKKNGVRHEIVVASNQGGVLHRMPIELDTDQLIGVNQNIPLRSKGVDIDWIKSDRQYRLVTSGNSVPVIWVSESK